MNWIESESKTRIPTVFLTTIPTVGNITKVYKFNFQLRNEKDPTIIPFDSHTLFSSTFTYLHTKLILVFFVQCLFRYFEIHDLLKLIDF